MPFSRLERRCVPFVSLSLLGFPRSDDQRMTRFIHAHLHCIFSLLSQRSLRKEAASLNPDQVFLRSREGNLAVCSSKGSSSFIELIFFSWIRMCTSSRTHSIRSGSVTKYGERYPRSNCIPST